MKFGTFISLLAGTVSAVLTITFLFESNYDKASIWGTVCTWAFANFFNELNLNKKEKQIQAIKDAIASSKDEVEAINKINEIL
jgi:H+/Cl- antiporter ClcA